MHDFVQLGLGTLYGDIELQDQMDSASIMQKVEATLWSHFERFVYVLSWDSILLSPRV